MAQSAWAARNRTLLSAKHKERYHANPAYRARQIEAVRLAELRKRGGVDAETEAMLPVLRGDPCAYCGCELIPEDRTRTNGCSLDHIDPKGDSHWTNLTAVCRSCNSAKGEMPLLLSMLERQLRRDLKPIAEQIFLIKGRSASRRRIDF